jgi:hypothetical protein
MPNKWLQHLAQFRRQNSEMPPKKLMKEARKTYRGGEGTKTPSAPSPYVKTMQNTMSHVKGAMDEIKMKGGNVVPFEPSSTDSSPSKVGGKRSRRNTRSRSRRTRRR